MAASPMEMAASPMEEYKHLNYEDLISEYEKHIIDAKFGHNPGPARKRICAAKYHLKNRFSKDDYQAFKKRIIHRVDNQFMCGGLFGWRGGGDSGAMRSKRRKKRKSRKNKKSRTRTRKNRGFKKNKKTKNRRR